MSKDQEHKEKVIQQLNLSNVYDVPKGRHEEIINEFIKISKVASIDKYEYICSDFHAFNDFLLLQDQLKSTRLNAERQAQLEPSRTETAIKALEDLGFEVQILSTTELSFTYKDAIIRYFPYSGWASGKTIKDGRGLKNLLLQVTPDSSKSV